MPVSQSRDPCHPYFYNDVKKYFFKDWYNLNLKITFMYFCLELRSDLSASKSSSVVSLLAEPLHEVQTLWD